MLARLLRETIVRLEHVPVSGPCMRGSTRNLPVAEVSRRRPAMPRRELELLRGVVVEPRRQLERVGNLAQFQTLTSRYSVSRCTGVLPSALIKWTSSSVDVR